MRVAGVLLAVLLIAACPPRRARVVYAPPCVVVPHAAVVGPTVPPLPPAKAADSELDAHLNAWEVKTASVTSFRAEIVFKRTDAVLKKESNFQGVALWMKPNLAVLRLDNTGDPTKTDYEAYICDGKSVYVYSGVAKTITEFKLPLEGLSQRLLGTQTDAFDIVTGMTAKGMKERFDISLLKTDEHYICLDIKPLLAKDQREFKHLRMALYGPGPKTATFAYLPAQVYLLKPNDDTEVWKFTNPQVNLPSISPDNFKFVDIKAAGWKVRKWPGSAEQIPPAKP